VTSTMRSVHNLMIRCHTAHLALEPRDSVGARSAAVLCQRVIMSESYGAIVKGKLKLKGRALPAVPGKKKCVAWRALG